ncbi:C40 family peptidase [Bacillus sp. FJAT-29790]|uniref:C40 family peptidase n=1 Tax=Bacillus sp. FJAT-29790 TaxID=1895002 RepID=UPI001C216FB3|nr:NlpC/P60 family protein [Bacillus sp. FJAT-29790]MBU8878003.1 C40 family peptidase [Bacillus sp. FJAT-29790]
MGGKTPTAGGFDCSGLLEYAFAQVGIDMYGTAQSQYNKTTSVPEDKIKPGDLVFSRIQARSIIYVGTVNLVMQLAEAVLLILPLKSGKNYIPS